MNYSFVVCFILFNGVLGAPLTEDLKSDFQDFAKLIPVEKIRAIAQKYIKNDQEYQYAVSYLQSKEWTDVVEQISAKPAAQVIKQYLLMHGIDVGSILKSTINILTGVKSSKRVRRGLKDFVQELKEAIPMEDIKALFDKKMQNSRDFQDFFALISSDLSRKLVEEIRDIPEIKRLVERLKEVGVDLKPTMDDMYELLGWNSRYD